MEVAWLVSGILGPVLVLAWWVWRDWWRAYALRKLDLSGVDKMTGTEFELLVAKLLRRDGYAVAHTGKTGDKGADLLTSDYCVQCKRYGIPVGTAAVQEAVTAARFHWRKYPVVVTNAGFTRGARELAAGTGCRLVGRQELSEWLQGRRVLR